MIVSLPLKYLTQDLSPILRIIDPSSIGLPLSIDELKTNPFLIENPDVNVYSRMLLKESNGISTKNIKRELQKHRLKRELIVVEPYSSGLAAVAARDNRVDAIRVNPDSRLSVFNTKYSRRLEENNKMVELDISFMFQNHLAKNLRPVKRVLDTFANADLHYILTFDIEDLMELRSYRGLQAIGRLLGISNKQSHPKHLLNRLERNRMKLTGTIPYPGVEINGS